MLPHRDLRSPFALGDYPEQVTITKALTLTGVEDNGRDAAVIVSPPVGVVANTTSTDTGSPVAAQVLVQNAQGVNIDHLSVDGSANGISGCDLVLVGIFYWNASGTVSRAVIRNQTLTSPLEGCQSGLGLLVQSSNDGTSTV